MKLAEQSDHTIIEDNIFAEFPRRALRLSMAWIASSASFVGGHLSADLLFSVLKDGDYRKLIDGLRERLPHATGRTSARLKSIGIAPWIEPRTGIFLGAASLKVSTPPTLRAARLPATSSLRPAMCSAVLSLRAISWASTCLNAPSRGSSK
ncbi:GntR family transcriptional regulator (fragment) [Methylocella tundrae]|uniref:GntR family transcriptional regulator n=1 Tax=Methylocella tundrae TaxID=227605 RepID=A0A8B6M8P7_METTU